MELEKFPETQNFGQVVDMLIQIKERSRMDFTKSKIDLLELGVKTYVGDELHCLSNLDVAKYEACSHQEFGWEAEYKDGTVLKQFQGEKQHHFGHIDQEKLSILRWVSHFNTETSNEDKRVIVSLDWETGKFSFFNGFASQAARAMGDNCFRGDGEPKLILKMVKRVSHAVGINDGVTAEIMHYKRYILGYQTGDDKRIICIEPNGRVHLWEQ